MLDTITEQGQRLVVMMGTRQAGTRAAVHTHPHAGHSSVILVAITPLIEGRAPVAVTAVQCYFMPKNRPMAATNLGTEDAVLIDALVLNPPDPVVIMLEDYP